MAETSPENSVSDQNGKAACVDVLEACRIELGRRMPSSPEGRVAEWAEALVTQGIVSRKLHPSNRDVFWHSGSSTHEGFEMSIGGEVVPCCVHLRPLVVLEESDTLRFREIGRGLSALAAQLPGEFKATAVSSDNLVSVRWREPESSDCVLGVFRDAQIPDELRELIEVAEVASLVNPGFFGPSRSLLVTRRSEWKTKYNLKCLSGASVLVSPGDVRVSGGGITSGGLERFSEFIESLNGQKCTFPAFGKGRNHRDGQSLADQLIKERVIIPQRLDAISEEKDCLRLLVAPAHASQFEAAYAKAGSERQRAFLQELLGLAVSWATLGSYVDGWKMDPDWPVCQVWIHGSTGPDERLRRQNIVSAEAEAERQRRRDKAAEKEEDREILKRHRRR